jgi:hypothetical protein
VGAIIYLALIFAYRTQKISEKAEKLKKRRTKSTINMKIF